MNKFKVRDKVKVLDSDINPEIIGKILPVVKTTDEEVYLEGIGMPWVRLINLHKIKLISRAKPPKFLLQYELDEDPVEYFETLPQARKRLKELVKDSTLKRHTVRLFEIKKELSVEIKDNIKITIK